METQPASWFFKSLDDGQGIPYPTNPSPPKKKNCSTELQACSVLSFGFLEL